MRKMTPLTHRTQMHKRLLIFWGLFLLLSLTALFLLLNPDLRRALPIGKKAERTDDRVPVSGIPLVLPEPEEKRKDPASERESGAAAEPSGITGAGGDKTYVSPIDFSALREKNPDIYAWISIEGSDISYPVVQNADDSFYLNHDENRKKSSEGAIFSESAYNGTSFDDSITVLYGHHMKSGRMFGNLQAMYPDMQQLEKSGKITVYTPERKLHYQIFAALPYDSRHIMYCYGSKGDRGEAAFLRSLLSVRSLDAVIDRERLPSSGDRLLVLSTCLKGDRTKRYIIAARLLQPE